MAEITGRVGWRNYISPISPLWNNLVAYYSGDNTANDAKGTANGTLVNGATYSTGKINGGFSLDGINDYVSLPNGTFAPTGDFSISLWFNFSELPVIKSLFNVGNFLTNSICVYIRSTGITFLVADNSTYQVLTAPSPSFNTWYNVVCVKNTTDNKYYLYINGALSVQNTITINHVLPANPINNIGYNPSQSGSFLPGKIDEVGAWNRALTAAEVAELYNAGAGKQYVAPVEASIVSSGLIMNLDAKNALSYPGTGTVWTDLSGNGNNGTLVNGTSYSSANGGTMVFDGINDYIRILTGLPTSNTLSVWFKQPAATGGGLLETNSLTGVGSGSPQLFVGLGANYLRTYGEPYGYSPNSAYTPTNWYNVTITGSSAGVRNIYMNGVLTATKSNIANYGYNSAINIGVGWPGYFNGNVPVVHLYNRVLTQAEITANFNALKGRYGL